MVLPYPDLDPGKDIGESSFGLCPKEIHNQFLYVKSTTIELSL
jgi:hypothetical protein